MDDFDDFQFNPNFERAQQAIESESSSEESASDSDEDGSDDDQQIESHSLQLSSEVSSLASLIALNQTYLDLIERIERKVESLLDSNREEQKKVKQLLSNNRPTTHCMTPNYRTIFLPPYFKDTYNMIPPSNEDSRAIRNSCRLNVLMKEEKSWSSEELSLLKRAVITQLIEAKNKEIIAKRDHIRDKIIKYNAEDKIEQLAKWKNELVSLNRRIDYLSSLDDETALKSSSYDDIDWAKIAVRDFKGTRSILQLKMKWLCEQAPNWNKGPWTETEDDCLKVSGRNPWPNWDLVAMKLDTKRSPFMCFERYHILYKKISSRRAWTTREDEKLLSLIDRFTVEDTIKWKRVAVHMPERNRIQCEIRYNRSLDPNLIHGRWSDDEDMLLIASVNKYGPHDWPRISRLVRGRTDVQCRARWVDNLDYKRSKTPWSLNEDEAVLVGIQMFGRSDYSSIAKMIPGRNTNSVKTRVRTLLRWKIIAARNNQVPANLSLKQVVENSRAKTEETYATNSQKTLERFNKIMELTKKAEENQHAFALAHRLGYGNYITEDGTQNADYSLIKQKLKDNFGQWFISKNGHWVRLKKNPNEFGKEEFDALVDGLPTDKRDILLKFRKERSRRKSKADASDGNVNRDPEQIDRIAKLMDTVLIIEQKDIDAYQKPHQVSGFSFLKLPVKSLIVKKKDKKPNQKTSFSTLIHDLAPRRYSIADRITDEITYRISQIPDEERRNYILNLMCEMISHQMDLEVQSRLNSVLKPVLNIKILNYLHKTLGQRIPESDELIVIDENSNQDTQDMPSTSRSSDNQDIPSTSRSSNNSAPFASASDSDLYQTLQRLIIPSTATCNVLIHFKNIIRPMLLKRARQLFPIMSTDLSPAVSLEQDNIFADIQLSKKVTSDSSYKLLKQRMMRTFLMPMLLKRTFESDAVRKGRIANRESQTELKEVQRDRLSEANVNLVGDVFIDESSKIPDGSNNAMIVETLNAILPFPVFNPQVKSRLIINDKSPDDIPTKRRRMQKISIPQSTETSIGQILTAELKKEFDNDFSLTNNEQLFQSTQTYITPNMHLPYRPRNTCFTPVQTPADMQKLSVRDFILMNQGLPPTMPITQRKSYKRRN